MPRFNQNGQVCQGYNRTWFDQARTIGQICEGGGCRILLSDGTQIAPYGAEFVSGGGGHWAAWSGFYGLGVTDSHGNRFQDSGIQNVGEHSPDGAYALKVLRNSYGPWDVIEGDGTRWRLTDGDPTVIQLLGNRQVMRYEGGKILTTNMPPIETPPGPIYWPRLINANGWKLLYQSAEGLVFDGRVVRAGSTFYRPDAICLNGTVVFVWALDEGESRLDSASIPLDQIYKLPIAGVPAPPPHVDTPPQPQPEPQPMSDVLATLKTVRAKYGVNNTPEQLGAMLNEVAWIHRAEGVGLERKDSGDVAIQPRTGIHIGHDILRFAGNVGRDVLGDAEGAAKTIWGDAGPADPARFVAPVEPETGTAPAPPTGDPLPPVASVGDQLDASLAALGRQIELLKGALAAQGAMIDTLREKVGDANTPGIDGTRIALRTDNGHYLCAEGGGGGDVNATRDAAGGWETFTLERR